MELVDYEPGVFPPLRYATYLYEWIHALGQERRLADLLEQKDPRLAPYMRKADAGDG